MRESCKAIESQPDSLTTNGESAAVARQCWSAPADATQLSHPSAESAHAIKSTEREATHLNSERFDELKYALIRQAGVEMTQENDRITYRFVDSKRVLFETANDESGINDAIKCFGDQARRLKSTIEQKYGITFATASDAIPQTVENTNCTMTAGPKVACRQPRLIELVAVQAALAHWTPPSDKPDRKRLRFDFLTGSLSQKLGSSGHYVDDDGSGNRAIVIDDGSTYGFGPLFADAGTDSLECFFAHELAHASQHALGMGGRADKATYAKQLGWVSYLNSKDNSLAWMLRGKNNQYYSSTKGCGTAMEFAQVNRKGEPLSAQRTPTDFDDALHPSTAFLTNIAMVRPITDYFNQPNEELAEALMYYRTSEQTRSKLLHMSPRLYDVAKHLDQKEIDMNVSASADSHHKVIREFDGTIVRYSRDAAKEIALREKEAANKKQ